MIGLLLSVSSATATALAVVAAVAIDLRVNPSGLMNSSQYVGSGLAAWLVGSVVETVGWNGFAPTLMVGALISTAAMWRLMNNSAERRASDTETA